MLLTADNLQLTHPAVAVAVERRDRNALQQRIARLVAAGAVTDRPLLIDTLNPQAIRAALAAGVPNRLIINGFSLEPARLERILPLAVEFDVEIIGYLLDERSHVPTGVEEKLGVAMALYQQALAAGLRPQQLIIDPVVAPLSWQDASMHNHALLKVLQLLPDMLGFAVKTAASLSNLTTGPAARQHKEKLEQAFIPMLAAHGLSIILVNMDHRRSVDMVRLSGWLLNDEVFAWRQVEALGEPGR